MANAFFGKTMESPRNRRKIKITNDDAKVRSYVQNRNFVHLEELMEDTVSGSVTYEISLNHARLVDKTPFLVGYSVLQ